jgi:hypothetical protein
VNHKIAADITKLATNAIESRPATIATLGVLAAGTMLSPTVAPWAALAGAGLVTGHALLTPNFSFLGGLKAIADDIKRTPDDLIPAEGVLLLGRHPNTGSELRLTPEQALQHVAVIGDTSQGKSEVLRSMAESAMMAGAGLVFLDGNGDPTTVGKLQASAKLAGREEDVLVLNFLAAGTAPAGPKQDGNTSRGRDLNPFAFAWPDRDREMSPSDTFNPFATASSDNLTEMMVALLDEPGGDGPLWKGRATAMMTGLMRALTYLRDEYGLELTASTIRDYVGLEALISFLDDQKYRVLPESVRFPIKSYLTSLPGFRLEKGLRQAQTTIDQHGYLDMQFSRILSALVDVYGGIFVGSAPDIVIDDVLARRRVLIVILPVLQRSSMEVEGLAKFVLAALKGAAGARQARAGEQAHREKGTPPFFVFLENVSEYVPDSVVPLTNPGSGVAVVSSVPDPFWDSENPGRVVRPSLLMKLQTWIKLELSTKATISRFVSQRVDRPIALAFPRARSAELVNLDDLASRASKA